MMATVNTTEALPSSLIFNDQAGSRVASFVTTLVFTILATAFTIAIRRRYFSPISHIPGPFWASVTRLWHISHIFKGDQNYKLVELHDKHGYFVRNSHDEVSVSHPQAVRSLYLNSVPKGRWYQIFVFPDWRFPAAISIRNPKDKVEFMKYMSNAGFLLHNVLQQEDILDDNISKLFGWIDKHAESGESMELSDFFTYVAFDIVGDLTFSKPFGFITEGKDVGNAIAANVGLQIFLCTFGHYIWASYLLNNPLMTWSQLLPVGHVVNTSISALKERAKNPDVHFDMSAHWFKGLEKAKKDNYPKFTEKHMLAAAVSNLGAGSDTVSCGMQTFVYYLHRMPERWARLRAEIDVARTGGKCLDNVIAYGDASKLPYLEACIKESLRILPPVPMGLPRLAPKGGITIGGMTFPEGTTLSINPTVLHHSKEIWGEDAREFNPERWLAPDIASREKYFMAFGLGWGACPGQNLAKVQMFKVLATLVRDYDIRLVNPKKPWSWKAYFTLNPHSWPVYITRRQ